MTPPFEQGPIRPPSEATSLLVRVVRNCPWNRCAFCPVYKRRSPSNRPVEEILADVDAMHAAAETIRTRSPGKALRDGSVPPEAGQVALFLHHGARHVFLQDADPCAAPAAKVAAVLRRVTERFPTVDRVTTYGRAATIARRSDDQIRALADAGLNRVHVGLESGSDAVLRAIDKGCTAAEFVTAGRRVLEAGMELCFYVMPGIGGREASAEHVRGTAEVIRAVAGFAPPERPLVVRLRTAAVIPGTPLATRAADGAFDLPDDVETASEIRSLLEALGDAVLEIRSDHVLNLLPEIDGAWPADREPLVGYLDEFLGLSLRQRAEFAVGRRMGVFGSLADRDSAQRRMMLAAALRDSGDPDDAELLDAAKAMRTNFV